MNCIKDYMILLLEQKILRLNYCLTHLDTNIRKLDYIKAQFGLPPSTHNYVFQSQEGMILNL